ncbi:hypothetical protein [Streptomyces sp. NPDC018045]|uniref:hypothetical protein n=1 Tax=Streptomyces sp. NPDC018045 TaxID=3365037 RepID=UPI0037A0CFC7
MLRVEERRPDGRTSLLLARAVPVDAIGPTLVAVGQVTGRLAVPAPRPSADDGLCALAVAVGVLGR